jgi:hypothetical protein
LTTSLQIETPIRRTVFSDQCIQPFRSWSPPHASYWAGATTNRWAAKLLGHDAKTITDDSLVAQFIEAFKLAVSFRAKSSERSRGFCGIVDGGFRVVL